MQSGPASFLFKFIVYEMPSNVCDLGTCIIHLADHPHQSGLILTYLDYPPTSTFARLITKPLVSPGGSLQLNLDASRGEVRVGIALADPIPTYDGTTPTTAAHMYEYNQLPGFSFGDCVPLNCNNTEVSVQFKGQANLDSLRGKSVRLLFRVFDADIYGFIFGGDR